MKADFHKLHNTKLAQSSALGQPVISCGICSNMELEGSTETPRLCTDDQQEMVLKNLRNTQARGGTGALRVR